MKNEHVGLRNESVFCFNCGDQHIIPMPCQVNVMTDIIDGFTKRHFNCEKTWTEPKPDEGLSVNQKMNFWLANGERGISANTIFQTISGVQALKGNPSHPHDPDDFGRCYKLLQAIPEWRSQMNKLRRLSIAWDNLVENWDKLTEMYEQNKKEDWKNHEKIGMYDLMQTLIKNA
ncbi:MAG: hypothetical protein KBC56_08980 [Flavobacterium sp.]|nr:hypothetical protein [Flavobacterium sp.]